MHKKVKFIYFDVGGVLILDFSNTTKWQELKSDLGITPETDPEFETVWQKHKDRICLNLDVDSLIPEIQAKTKIKLPKSYSLLNDFVNRFQANPSIWPVLKLARNQYKIGLLTNMYPRMLEVIKKANLLPEIKWDEIIDSSQVMKQKPNPEIFELATEKSGVKNNEILFIDNSLENILAAQKMGWQAMHYNEQKPEESSQQLMEIL